MGIQGLHKGLSFATQKTSIRDFRGKVLAIDTSSWLHKSVYSVAEKYVEGLARNHIEEVCVRVSAKYITSRARELLDCFQIARVFLVMDGERCPLKAETNGERERRRLANLEEARAFKRRGLTHKAEGKYQMCIKIKDELTKKVLAKVKESFRNDDRLHLVWSPYEADAQLAKLCVDGAADAVVTEDSDVLVYSAATHCSFPVIFKLDRRSGSCDVISMDWLLNYKEENRDNTVASKSAGALEVLLKNFASRQARRPGFGVRLFVQGCVLAGCDYAPNKLAGVGLVNAFKHIRDNAFRNETQRFQKVLEAIPQKNKVNIDIKKYELILAKSEAVFYYHVVRHQDRCNKPLCETKLIEPGEAEPHSFKHHSPLMSRFADASFVGSSKVPTRKAFLESKTDSRPLSIKRNIQLHNEAAIQTPVVQKETTIPRSFLLNKQGNSVDNPYTKCGYSSTILSKKRIREQATPKPKQLDPNSDAATIPEKGKTNHFAKFRRISTSDETKSDGIQKYREGSDPRFVKRRFASCHEPYNSKSKNVSPRGFQYNEVADVEIVSSSQEEPSEVSPSKNTLQSRNEVFIDDDTRQSPPIFFDMTDSNSGPFPTLEDVMCNEDEDGFIIEEGVPSRVSLDSTFDASTKNASQSLQGRRSKYFGGSNSCVPPAGKTIQNRALKEIVDPSEEIQRSGEEHVDRAKGKKNIKKQTLFHKSLHFNSGQRLHRPLGAPAKGFRRQEVLSRKSNLNHRRSSVESLRGKKSAARGTPSIKCFFASSPNNAPA